MRVLIAPFTAIMLASALASNVYAQTSRGAANIRAQMQNFTPMQKAACGPNFGRHCGPHHVWVCRNGNCWCAHC